MVILGDSRNNMPPILVPSSVKRIATQILAIAKLNGRNEFILRAFLFMISFVPARNYMFKISNLSTRISCESCLILRMLMLTIFNINDVYSQWRRSSVFIVNCKHISNFADFEQANFCLVHSEKADIFEDKIGHIMRYVLF